MSENMTTPPDDFDPFGDIPESGKEAPPPERKPERPRKKRSASRSRRVAYAAVGTAISVVMMVLTCYLPLTVAPLVMISLCYNVVTDKCGVGYGIMTVLASVGLGFLCCAANVAVLLIVVIVFVPYSALCLLLGRLRLDYGGVRKALIRGVSIAAFAALEVLFIYLLGGIVADFIDLAGLMSAIGSLAVGYVVVTLLAIVVFLCIDFLFIAMGRQITRRLK